MAPVQLIMHHPETETGKEELARRVSAVHAACVNRQLRSLTCPARQKLKLMESVMETAKEGNRPQTEKNTGK